MTTRKRTGRRSQAVNRRKVRSQLFNFTLHTASSSRHGTVQFSDDNDQLNWHPHNTAPLVHQIHIHQSNCTRTGLERPPSKGPVQLGSSNRVTVRKTQHNRAIPTGVFTSSSPADIGLLLPIRKQITLTYMSPDSQRILLVRVYANKQKTAHRH